MKNKKRIIVGITGASGAIYSATLLKALRSCSVETHLVISKAGLVTLAHETSYKKADIVALADHYHPIDNIGATIASGSFKTDGMIIVPCSIKTMSEIATGVTPNLLSRAADVTLKEKRQLVLSVRETPFHRGHLENMLQLSKMGAVIFPPIPAFYHLPSSIEEIVNHTVGRILALMSIDSDMVSPWQGLKK